MVAARYHIVGDIHGNYDGLCRLFKEKGYEKRRGVWRPPDNDTEVVYIGDLINQGSENEVVVKAIRDMTNEGIARVIMGNHEIMYLLYGMKDKNGNYLLPHSKFFESKLSKTFNEIAFDSKKYHDIADWFKTFPLYIETDGFIATHSNHEKSLVGSIKPYLNDDNTLLKEAYEQYAEDKIFADALRKLVTGPDIILPDDVIAQLPLKGNGKKHPPQRRICWWKKFEPGNSLALLGFEDMELSKEACSQLWNLLKPYKDMLF